jgi:hypothetical protein
MNLSKSLLLLSLCAAPALAGTVYVHVPSGIDLARSKECYLKGADLAISAFKIDAPFGIKLDGVREFAASSPIILETAYLVRDRSGEVFRVWVHGIEGTLRRVEVKRLEEPKLDLAKLSGRYQRSAFRIQGEAAASTFPDLRLYSDGTYRLGGASGRWDVSTGSVSLDGYYGNWGVAEVSDDARTLTFRYTRGKLSFELDYVRQGSLDELASAAR